VVVLGRVRGLANGVCVLHAGRTCIGIEGDRRSRALRALLAVEGGDRCHIWYIVTGLVSPETQILAVGVTSHLPTPRSNA